MKDFKRIVVGVDLDVHGTRLTVGSARAIDQAEWLAWKIGGSVELVHSTRTDRYVEAQDGNWVIVHEGLSPAGENALTQAAERLRSAEIECTLSVREDRPYLALCREAMEFDADLVILGKHEDPTETTKIGTVAASVLRNCPTPVWVVRPGSELSPKVILAATDLTDVGARSVRYAAYLADQASAQLHVVHAYQVEMSAQMAVAAQEELEIGALRARAVRAVEEQVRAAECDSEPELHVVCNSPSHAIRAFDEKLEPDLVVMGMVSRTGVPGLLLGNTAERVLPRLHCSVLTVKPEGFVSPVLPE